MDRSEGFGLVGAEVRPDVDMVLELVGRSAGADLVVTREGSLDRQSLAGKAPVGVARVDRDHGVSVVAGRGRWPADCRVVGLRRISAAYPSPDLEADVGRASPTRLS